MSIVDNIININKRIQKTCHKIGRDASEITIVAVTKTVPADDIRLAIQNGIQHIGENRIQEADEKFRQLGKIATWHLVGHLQSNKVKKAVELFDLIQSVDSLHLAQEISRRIVDSQREIDCLIEVNTSEEATKYGAAVDSVLNLIKQISLLPGIRIKGLMTVGAFLPDPEEVRPGFKLLKELGNEIMKAGVDKVDMKYLSMGMTNDFDVAIEEGSNMIRIGRAIFGERH